MSLVKPCRFFVFVLLFTVGAAGFAEEAITGLPKMYHQIGALFDGRINRHQLLAIFKPASDKPVEED